MEIIIKRAERIHCARSLLCPI